jgi:hypothetical protein
MQVIAYPAVNVIGLCSLPQIPAVSAVNHPAMHGDCFAEYIVDQIGPVRMKHRRNATFGQCQID